MDLSELSPPLLRAAIALAKEEDIPAAPDPEADSILADLSMASSSHEMLKVLDRIVAYASWGSGKNQEQMRELAERARALKEQIQRGVVTKAVGAAEGGFLLGALGPTEQAEDTPFGQHRRAEYTGEIPPSTERLSAHRLGSLESRMAVVERDIAAILYELKRLKA